MQSEPALKFQFPHFRAVSFVLPIVEQTKMGISSMCASATTTPHGPLCALAVFQHLSNLELIKSVHLYMGEILVTAVQQEFLLSPDVYTQISEPTPSYFSKFAHNGAKQFINTLKELNEADLWHCVLEYYVHTPQDTSIIPLLSVSKNPSLHYIPALAEDLVEVERAVQNLVQGQQQCIPLLGLAALNEQQHFSGSSSQSFSKCAHYSGNSSKWNCTGFADLDGDSAVMSDSMVDGVPSETNSQVENLHDWGSDLELASPRMFETCVLGSSWSTSISSMPLTGLISASSLTSSMITNHKSDYPSWSPSSLVLESQMAGAYTFHDSSLLSDDSSFRQAKLVAVSDASQTGDLCHSGSYLGPACASVIVSDTVSSPHVVRSMAERTMSYCSDESVGEQAGPERLPSSFSSGVLPSGSLNFVSTECREEILRQRISSFEPIQVGKDVGLRVENLSMKILDEEAELPNQRGATERMTEITLHELSHYFHMPITQASKELKVGLTVLKKRCREFGIPRWPHRKMKSLNSLIQNIQELARGPGGGTSAPVMCAVKELEYQKRRMEERPGIELAERTKRLRQACFKASYKKRRQALANLLQQDAIDDNVKDEAVGMAGELPSVQIR